MRRNDAAGEENGLNITFDKYHSYDEIRKFLQDCVREYPDLCRIECIGKSYENREILMIEITNKKTGRGADKPGIYADGNTHAGEVTGAEVILYPIKQILEGYGKDDRITRLVDTRVFYFIPRITVDGSEYYHDAVHAAVEPASVHLPGCGRQTYFIPEDIDGDGRYCR